MIFQKSLSLEPNFEIGEKKKASGERSVEYGGWSSSSNKNSRIRPWQLPKCMTSHIFSRDVFGIGIGIWSFYLRDNL